MPYFARDVVNNEHFPREEASKTNDRQGHSEHENDWKLDRQQSSRKHQHDKRRGNDDGEPDRKADDQAVQVVGGVKE